MQIFGFLGSILGYVLWAAFYVFQNFGLAIIVFTLVIKLILFPFSVKQQKSMAGTARLQKKQKELQEKYANNKQKLQEETSKLYEKEGDYVKAVGYLDMLLGTYEPKAGNFDLILRIGTLLEHKVKNDTLTELFFSSIEGEYYRVRKVRDYARAKLRRLEEKKQRLMAYLNMLQNMIFQ